MLSHVAGFTPQPFPLSAPSASPLVPPLATPLVPCARAPAPRASSPPFPLSPLPTLPPFLSPPFPLTFPPASSPPLPHLAQPPAPFSPTPHLVSALKPHVPTSSLPSPLPAPPLPFRAAARHCCPHPRPLSHWRANLLLWTLEKVEAEVRAHHSGSHRSATDADFHCLFAPPLPPALRPVLLAATVLFPPLPPPLLQPGAPPARLCLPHLPLPLLLTPPPSQIGFFSCATVRLRDCASPVIFLSPSIATLPDAPLFPSQLLPLPHTHALPRCYPHPSISRPPPRSPCSPTRSPLAPFFALTLLVLARVVPPSIPLTRTSPPLHLPINSLFRPCTPAPSFPCHVFSHLSLR
ncbi:unnamed protein product [Closterium sp. Yama58-4]|nr:unnamed protein product [Closterium sp. Yama58-4]